MATGKPASQVAQELCISSNLLYFWKSRFQSTQLESDELRALRRENVRLTIENDIVKKAAIILGSKTPSNSGK